MEKCNVCDGEGWLNTSDTHLVRCKMCSGTGEVFEQIKCVCCESNAVDFYLNNPYCEDHLEMLIEQSYWSPKWRRGCLMLITLGAIAVSGGLYYLLNYLFS